MDLDLKCPKCHSTDITEREGGTASQHTLRRVCRTCGWSNVEPYPTKAKDAMACPACNGKGRLRTTGGKCDACNGTGKMTASGAGKAPLKLREPGTPSGWGENYRTTSDAGGRRARLHRALDKVMDRRGAKDSAKGMTSTELRDEIRGVKALISGSAGITLKRSDPKRYTDLEKRLTELLDAASYR